MGIGPKAALVVTFQDDGNMSSRFQAILHQFQEDLEKFGAEQFAMLTDEPANAIIIMSTLSLDEATEADPPLNSGIPDDTSENEIDRNARAYGFEIGRGKPLERELSEISPDNPFIHPFWRSRNGLI